jgi:chromosome transmission fidelity protein 4
MIHLEFERDKLGDELTTESIARREMEQDKKLIKLINTACKDDKPSRVIDWVRMLNHLQSFDGAIKIAEFYRLVGLKEKIELLRAERQGEDRLEKGRDKRRELAALMAPRPLPRTYVVNQPSSDSGRPRLLQDFRPPPAIHRPGLAPAVPAIETTRYSTANLPSRAPSTGSSTTPEGKRKRDDESDNASKRLAIESEIMGPPAPKASMHIARDFVRRFAHAIVVETNPFARKAGQEINRNPFARKADTNKTIQKSESFFDKVDGAETDTGKRMFDSGFFCIELIQ